MGRPGQPRRRQTSVPRPKATRSRPATTGARVWWCCPCPTPRVGRRRGRGRAACSFPSMRPGSGCCSAARLRSSCIVPLRRPARAARRRTGRGSGSWISSRTTPAPSWARDLLWGIPSSSARAAGPSATRHAAGGPPRRGADGQSGTTLGSSSGSLRPRRATSSSWPTRARCCCPIDRRYARRSASMAPRLGRWDFRPDNTPGKREAGRATRSGGGQQRRGRRLQDRPRRLAAGARRFERPSAPGARLPQPDRACRRRPLGRGYGLWPSIRDHAARPRRAHVRSESARIAGRQRPPIGRFLAFAERSARRNGPYRLPGAAE